MVIIKFSLFYFRFQKICECDEDEDEEEKSHLNIQIPINKKPKMETEDTVSLPDWLEDDNQFNESDHKVSFMFFMSPFINNLSRSLVYSSCLISYYYYICILLSLSSSSEPKYGIH